MLEILIKTTVDLVKSNEKNILLYYYHDLLFKIIYANSLNLYKSHCNFIIDRNEVMYHIKRLTI